MINVFEVVVDPDMIAPKPFTILRSTGQFVLGGFQSITTSIPLFGPVQQATDKEVAMLATNDRISAVRAFWSTQVVYETRGKAPVPATHGEIPTGSGLVYALSSAPPADSLTVYSGGLLLLPYIGYTVAGNVLTLAAAPGTPLYVTWPVTVDVANNASDLIVYDAEQYRILRVYRDPGSGYWKAYGTRTEAN